MYVRIYVYESHLVSVWAKACGGSRDQVTIVANNLTWWLPVSESVVLTIVPPYWLI